ncbi:Ig-like domain-containing protein [Escherichia coli]|nr:Ig-like domain-containing protein [Escherichia coli]
MDINTIATDDIINASEKGADLQISGTSNQPAGTTITLALNGQNYTATTDAAGNWSTTVPASAVGALGEASYTVTANVTDSAGNSNSASHNVQVNTALPGVTINPVATDDIINAAESGNAQTISGQVTGAAAGDTVTVTLGGKTYTATVQGNLSWSVDVPAADIQAIGNGNLTVNASVTNGVGNTGSGSRDITIDANLPGLRVDTVAGDDVVNSIEHAQALVITGSSSGLAAGAALTVVINTVTYAATVLADGTWSVGVPAADVSNWPAGTVNITVSGTNTAGTTSTITHPVTVDLAAVAISINTVSGDDVINAAEKGADLTLSGSTSGVEVGQTVTVTFGGKTYTATVAGDGSWTTTVPAADLSVLRDGDATVQASVSTINGNTASATHAYSVDATAPTLAINTIATDDILNAAEAGNPLTISGSSTAEAGQTVTVTLNGVTYSGSVQADGSWSVSLPTADLSNLTASQYTVSASVSDKAGNPASANHGLAVDLTVPVLTINTVSGDDIINAAEHGQALVISGSSTGGEAGDVITVTLNSKTYTTMLDASGNWSVGVPAADVTALGSGPQTITAAITDAAGNSDDASRTVTVNLAAPTIGINTIATDDVIKATEKGADLQITGTSNQPAGTTITVTLNGQNYTATTDSNGNWSATVPASAVSALGEANYTVTANVTDTAGNSNSASHNVLVNSALPAVTINAVATDDIINAAESGNAQTISGQVTGAAQGDTVTVTLGGNTYTATVQSNLSWSVDVPAADIQALGNGDLTVNASVTNGVGNTGSGSRDITIDANLPGLRVDTVAGDDVINSIEHNQALVITGSSSGLTAGTALTVEINNVTYGATVLADGTWSLGVPAVDVSNWPAGTVNITVSGTNSAGTTSTITHPVTVDLAGVAITINTLSGDDVINAVEKGETLVVSGSTSGVEAGQTVTVTFGGKNYTTTVEANGSWTVNVPPADLAALPDGAGNVQASVSNINGNSAQADRAYSVDATAPLVTINTIASDDILNVSEAGAGITISGTTTAQAGQTLTVTLNNNTYQTTVLADGTWSVNVPAADLSGLTASSYTVTATVSDKAGNPASADHALVVDITAPDLTINTVAGDDIINAIEHGQALVVSGTSTGAAAGDVVTVTLNGKNYTTTLDASGNWSVGIPAADVTALATGSQTITASLSDRAGNSDSTTHDVTVDLSGPTLTINTVSGDDIINAAEIVVAQTISGQVTGTAVAGNTVIVTIGGNQYNATVQSDLSWSVSVPANVLQALGNGELTISASLTNSANNTGTATHDIVIDANLPGLRVDTVAGDDVINSIEHTQALVITGSSSGLAAGAALTVVINSVTYGATVLADGSWSVGVPVADVTNWPAGTVNIAVSGTNTAGTTTSISHPVTVDLAAVAITINTLSTDDVINAAEKGSDLQLSGTTSGVEAGQTITVIFGGKSYTTTVAADNTWGLTIPAVDVATLPDGAANVQASVSNVAGNSTQATHAYSVDATAPSVTINTIATDDILNAAEAGSALTISGTSTAEAGQTVTVTLNGVNYSGNVQADGSWSVSVPTGDLASLTASSYTVNASVSDKARNSASATHNLTVDLAAPVVTINTVAGDDIINATEHGQAQIISGSATGATTGNTVSVTIGTTTYTTVLDANGNWSIGVPASVISALAQGDVTITATVTDSAGNSGTASHTVTVALGAPVLAINTIAVDDIINAAEKGADLAITGTSNQPAGTQITVTLNGQNYTTTADASGNWSVTVPASRVSALGEATYTVTAAATDADGNSGSASHNVQVNTALPGVTINVVATDDIINAAEAGVEQTISGQVTGAAAGDTVTVTLGGATYTATVQANLSWSVDVPASALQELGNGELTISASVTNSVGNTGNGTREITIDANLPGLRVDTVAGDDVVNIIEHGQALVITGSSSGLAAGSNVTLTINGQTYVAAVLADGTWSVGVPAVDVSAWPAGSVTIAASGSTSAGNPVSVTHPVTVDLSAVAVSINAITADDVINAAEKGAALTLSGSTSGVEAGQTVTVTFGGKTYSATVAANGSWSTSVPAADVTALGSGAQTITASVSDRAGNSDDASRTVTVSLSAPVISINTIAGDDVINATEKGSDLALSGTSDQPAGTAITVTLNGQNYSATTDASGNWSVTVPASAVSALGEATYSVTASVTNAQGNSSTASHNVQVNTALPGITINPVATDDIINASEAGSAQTISGQVTGAAAGSTVTVELGGKTYTATVQADLSWNVSVPAADWQALGNGELTVNASVTNAVGNTGSGTRDITIDASLPGLRVDTVAGDDVVNIIEHAQAQVITGSSSGFAAGTALTVVINNQTYAATVLANGSWSVGVPATDVSNWPAGTLNITVSGANSAGTQTSITHPLTVDLTAVAISMNSITSDDAINAAEKGAALTLSGSTSGVEAGQTVTVTFGGKTYTTTVAANGSWSTTVPAADLAALRDGDASAQVRVTNVNGNSATATHEYSVDSAAPTVTINTIASDNIINASEAAAGVTVSGTSTAQTGQTLTVTLNGTNYQTTVQTDGSWSLTLPASDLTALANNGYTLTATVSDLAGNLGSASKGVTVDTTAPVISFNTVAGDDVINNVEHIQAQIISGTATGAVAGDRLVVTIAGQQYVTSTDASGNWSVGVPASVISGLADGTVTISATITDSAGNSSTQTHNVQVNTAAVSLSVSTISGDNLINAAEAGSALTLSGTGTNFATGTVVTVLLNGKGYSATIQSNGSWSVNVPAADVAALSDGTSYTVSASAQDSAGNSATASRSVAVDLTAPVISINTVSTDDRLNAAEQQQPLTLNGSTSAEVGQTVTVTFGGKTYTATVAANGTWALNVPAVDLAALGQGAQTITASVNDRAGNPGQATHALTVDTVAPTVTIATVAGDDIINNAEQLAGQTISGTTTAEVGQTVTVTFNGQTWSATVGSGGSWSVFIPAQQFAGLSDGSYTISATVSDQAGNPGSASRGVTLNGDVPTVTINTFAGDDVVNAAEHGSSLVISGTTTAPVGQTLTLTLNGKTYTTTVQTGGSWSYTLGSADVTALADGNAYVINASVSNAIGNTGSSNHTITVDLSAPAMGINIDSLQADTGLSASDFITSVSPVVVNGSLTAALASNETAQISIDGGTTWTTLTVTGTTWRYNDSRTLTDGNYLYQVRVIDAAGNVGATDSQNVVIDTTAPDPAVKTIAISAITTDMGLITNDFVTSDTTLAVSGTLGATLSAGEFAQISLDGGVTWTTLTVVGTSWSYADGHTLTDGTWNYTVRVVDLAGNVGQTATQNVVVDTTSPEAAKSITITGISDDTGTSSSDFITSDTTLTVRGVLGAALGANEFAQISTDNGATWVNVTVAADSLNWSYVDGRTLTNGTTTWQVRVVDLAGNVGATSSQSALIDTVNPAQVLTIASISTDTGSSATDFITSDTMLTLTGSLGAGLASGEVAQISLDSGATWTTLTTNGTQWTYTDSRTLTDGSYVYQVRVLDLAGNTGPVVSKTVVVDTINPTATPTIVSYTDDVGQRQGTLSSSQATDDTTPLLNGVLSAPLASGEVVYLYRNGLLLGAVTMVGALNWTYSDSGLVSGAYTYSARVVDLAGNITSSSDFVLTVDTSIPTTLAQITSQTTRDTTPIISGVITAALASGQYVEVVINGKTYTSEPGGAVVVDPAHNTWYVQLPDTDALTVSATAYTVTAQVKSSAGNGNNANISNGTVTVNAAIDYTPTWTTASKTTAWGLTYGLDSHGMWTVLANQQVMQSTDPLTWSKTALTLYQSGNNYATSSIADYDRNGTGDLFITRDDYGTGYINGFTNNGDGTFSSAIQVTVGTLTWYGSIVAFDKEGDGYLDFWIGDAGGPDSNTFLWNNAGTLVGNSTTSNSGGSATVGGAVTGYLSLNEGSGVDLNNDGRIDLVQHTYNLNNYYTLSSLINQGNGTFVWGQNTTNTFLSGAGSGAMSSSVSMTWADFDGDGDMDLFLPASQGRANYGSLLFNTNGVLGSPVAVGATATTYASQFSLAVDWNHDGLMDIARIAQTGQSYLYTNVSNASNWTQSALGGSQSGTTSGVAAMDYDWDGAVDVLVSKQSGSVFLSRNTNTVSYGTSLHLRITDPNGINVYYGNTVKLYNSAGVLVATQIINPQSGMGVNDTSALVNFYGLNAGETYNAVLIKSTGTTASNIDQTVNTSWGGLQATDATHAYDLSAEAGTASNNGKFVGTGYNDTFFATAGTDTYDGSGGWVYSSGTGTWLANGGMDVVDFRLSTVGVTANLSSTAAQATGFNTSTFTNIEGISGSNFNDILTGSSGDNQLEGRGGNDTLNIGNGGHDTLLYKLLNASDATGGNGSDVVNGFTVGTWEGTADTDRIDIRELLQGSGYTGNGKASYVNGVATLDAQAGNIGDFVKVTQSGSDTIVQIDRDGTGGTFATTNVVTLTGVHTDLATLLANHQLMVV